MIRTKQLNQKDFIKFLMKNVLTTLAIVVFGCFYSHAQNKWCYTPNTINKHTRFNRINSSHRSVVTIDPPIKVAIAFYNFYLSDGYGKIPQENIDSAIEYLNNVFAPAKMSFFIIDEIHHIMSNRLAEFDIKEGSEDNNEVDRFYSIDGALNIYTFPFPKEGYTYLLGWCGRAYFPESGIDKIYLNSNCDLNELLAHEVGHYFSLLHTHTTVDGKELVDGSNCSTAGDLICDTPADPGLSNNVNEACEYIGTAKDTNNQPYSPSISNLMSYAPNSCRNSFSSQQIEQMIGAYNTYKTYISQNDYLAQFSAERKIICPEAKVAFENKSINAESYEWSFEGGTPSKSTEKNPEVAYTQPGSFDVSLTITNKNGLTNTKTYQEYITVETPIVSETAIIEGSFEEETIKEEIINPDHIKTFEKVPSLSTDGLQSVMMNFYDYEDAKGQEDYLILGRLNQLESKTCYLSFDYAYTPHDEEFFDKLAVVFREPCGEWSTLWEKEGGELQTTKSSVKNTLFVPKSDEWKNVIIEISDKTQDYETLEFAFKTTNGRGNALYLDNYKVIPVPKQPQIIYNNNQLSIIETEGLNVKWFLNDILIDIPSTYSITIDKIGKYKAIVNNGECDVESEIYEVTQLPVALSLLSNAKTQFTVYPSPSSGIINIDIAEELIAKKPEVKIIDLSGKIRISTTYTRSVNISTLPDGVYMVQIVNPSYSMKRSIILRK
ncbi:T9SS type A sorting domain-containing protein [Reichenbachiella versicolor]|uniref:T9SS type A sorting domain-containing protein n=1 Tax=Reichenbachiella versicolor TaxID=1821036 RepID=UPI000D6E2D1E|nr:T9SS type A sorting domain-containing protein [Reichenbachiella versicolor]